MHASAVAQASEHEVTAADYCKLLNQEAVTDEQYLYNEAMGTDPEAACIFRLGAPGKYFYQVIAGREKFPIPYVPEAGKNDYCRTMNAVAFYAEEHSAGEDFPASNQLFFCVIPPTSTSLLMLPPASSVAESITKADVDIFAEATVTAIMTFFVGTSRLGRADEVQTFRTEQELEASEDNFFRESETPSHTEPMHLSDTVERQYLTEDMPSVAARETSNSTIHETVNTLVKLYTRHRRLRSNLVNAIAYTFYNSIEQNASSLWKWATEREPTDHETSVFVNEQTRLLPSSIGKKYGATLE